MAFDTGRLLVLLTGLYVVRCHVPISGQTLLAMAAATGELHLYQLSENEVKHNNFRVHALFFVFFFSVSKWEKGVFIFSFLSLLNMCYVCN